MEESNQLSLYYSGFVLNSSPKIKKNNSVLLRQLTNKYTDITSQHNIRLKNSINRKGHSPVISFNKEKFSDKDMESISQIEKNSLKFFKLDNRKNRRWESNKFNSPKKYFRKFETSKHICVRNTINCRTEKLIGKVSQKCVKKKKPLINLTVVPKDKEFNFDGKIKTMRENNKRNNVEVVSNKKEFLKSPTKINYLDMISQNILENSQTLNNPHEFYKDFFTNIVEKK